MRYPAVSGTFYPSNMGSLGRMVDAFLANARKEVKGEVKAKAIVCPHAGYIYSGQTAAFSFASVEKLLQKENTTAILLGPNHTGMGEIVSVSFDDWKTPVGTSNTDLQLAGAIIKSCALARKDEMAHFREHSIEVQLPFLQKINPKAKMVAICMGVQEIRVSREVGKAVFEATRMKEFSDRNILVIASSDFTHYESGQRANMLDKMPIEFIKRLDAEGFQNEVEQNNLSICGHGPIAAAIEYSKLAGAKEGKLLRYTNSGKETGEGEEKVVSYSSFVMI